MKDIIESIRDYVPKTEQEVFDRAQMLKRLESGEELFSRENVGAHFTASAWVVNKDRTKVLMAYHNIYNSWAWLGGHADGERDLLSVALREVKEESGLSGIKPLTEDIISLEILTVAGHEKKGRYVSSHLHYNVTYLIEADEAEQIRNKPDENSAVAWFTPKEALEKSTEEWFKKRIYPKLTDFVAGIKPSLSVVAAVMEKEGRFLVCKRGYGGECAHLWEFPGGKIEERETPFDAIKRECMEELGAQIEPTSVLTEYPFAYPKRKMYFCFIRAKIMGEAVLNVHEDMAWLSPAEMDESLFCPADRAVVYKLKAENQG